MEINLRKLFELEGENVGILYAISRVIEIIGESKENQRVYVQSSAADENSNTVIDLPKDNNRMSYRKEMKRDQADGKTYEINSDALPTYKIVSLVNFKVKINVSLMMPLEPKRQVRVTPETEEEKQEREGIKKSVKPTGSKLGRTV